MNNLFFLCLLMSFNGEQVIIDFNKEYDIRKWYQTNDNVMGGISTSRMLLDKKGNGVFIGAVSLENNGGFAMTRVPLNVDLNKGITKIVLHLKGDGKKYQLRIKSKLKERFWYVRDFQTTMQFETIEIPLKEFYASFRGNKMSIENFSANRIEELAFLIGNKKEEKFELVIDKISVN